MVEGEETLESQKERTDRRFIEQKKRGQIPRKLYEESRFFTRYIYFITLCALALRRFSLLFCLPLTGKVAHSLVVRASASVNHPLFFQTARIMTSRWCGAAGKLDPKKPRIYYLERSAIYRHSLQLAIIIESSLVDSVHRASPLYL